MLARVKRHPLKKIRGPWAKKCRDHVALIGFWRTVAYLPLLLWIHLLAAWVEHVYSMTWSARRRSGCGIVSPKALAVFRLITNSNFVGCWTGRSPGLAPLRILST